MWPPAPACAGYLTGCMVPYRDELVNGETIFSLGVDSHERLWCVMNTGRCAVMQDRHVLSSAGAGLFFPGNEEITSYGHRQRATNIYLGSKGYPPWQRSPDRLPDWTRRTFPCACTMCLIPPSITGCILPPAAISWSQARRVFLWLTSDGQLRDSHSGACDAVNCAALDYEGNVTAGLLNEGLVRYKSRAAPLPT